MTLTRTYKRLGDLVNIRTGKLDANAANEGGKYPFFTCSREPLQIDSYSYDCECVLIAGNGDLNVKYYKGKFDAYQRTYIIEKKPGVDCLSTYYIYLFFQEYVKVLRAGSIGGIIKYIKLGDLTEAMIPIPEKAEQQAIIRELNAINTVIAAKNGQLRELDALAQVIFYDSFGDPLENPKGWNVLKLSDVVDEQCKMSYGIVQPGDDIEGGVPVVRPVDFKDSVYIKKDGLKRTLPSISESYKRTILRGDEILICVRGTTGTMGLATPDLKGCNVTRGIVPLYFKNGMNKWFMYEYLKSDFAQNIIAEYTYGATLKQINIGALRNIPVIVPPLDLQQSFAKKIEAIEAQKTTLRQSITEFESLLAQRMDVHFG